MTRRLSLHSAGAADTKAIAAAFAPYLTEGDVLILGGELGAGKTAFAQGLAEAVGVSDTVTSPTFTLVRHYRTAIGPDLLHADVYRLEQLREIVELGLPELLESGAFAVIEWGEKALPALGPEMIRVTIDFGAADDERVLEVEPSGAAWNARWDRLADALGSAAPRARVPESL